MAVTYGTYLLTKISCHARYFWGELQTPYVLASLLDHCNSPELFPHVRSAVDELLLAIDRGTQVNFVCHSLFILFLFSAFEDYEIMHMIIMMSMQI